MAKGVLVELSSGIENREAEAKFLRCSLHYEGALSTMDPAECSSKSL